MARRSMVGHVTLTHRMIVQLNPRQPEQEKAYLSSRLVNMPHIALSAMKYYIMCNMWHFNLVGHRADHTPHSAN